jgi:hypothetical protein
LGAADNLGWRVRVRWGALANSGALVGNFQKNPLLIIFIAINYCIVNNMFIFSYYTIIYN